jgi:hypothetical protein
MTSVTDNDRVLAELGRLPRATPDAARSTRTVTECVRRLERRQRSRPTPTPRTSLGSAALAAFSALLVVALVLDLVRAYGVR